MYLENDTGIVETGNIILCKYAKTVSPYRSAYIDFLPSNVATIVNSSLFVIRDIKCNKKYLQQVITTRFFQALLKKIAKGPMGAISSMDLAKIEIPLPNSAEQERIASKIIEYKQRHFELIDLLRRERDNRIKLLGQQIDDSIWNIS